MKRRRVHIAISSVMHDQMAKVPMMVKFSMLNIPMESVQFLRVLLWVMQPGKFWLYRWACGVGVVFGDAKLDVHAEELFFSQNLLWL